MILYLAGGMHSTWQDKIIEGLKNKSHTLIFDPRSHGLTNPKDYTEWDLHKVRISDYIVVAMTSDNPSGYGLSLEIGYAAALNKKIIFIDLIKEDWRSRYFDMARNLAHKIFPNVEEALSWLRFH